MTMTDPGPIPKIPADPSSPLARLREAHENRQKKRYLDLDVTGYEDLVARVSTIDDSNAAAYAVRFSSHLTADELAEAGTDIVNEAAKVIAAAVTALYMRNPVTGELERIEDAQGVPVRFDERYGAAVGLPEVATGVGAVFAAFTQGDPPKVNATALLMFAMQAAGFNVTDDSELTVKGS